LQEIRHSLQEALKQCKVLPLIIIRSDLGSVQCVT
jgi:hypothetical protein